MDLQLPKHIGIIMDGNRRFAQMAGEAAWEGHKYGKDKLEESLEWCRELGIKMLTVWAFSTENFNRDSEELKVLFGLMEQSFHGFSKDERVHKNKIKLNIIGNISLLPENVRQAIKAALDATKDYRDFTLNIALAYGGKQEITDAVKLIAQKVKDGIITPEDITKEVVEAHTYSAQVPDIDLVIRTSGEQRTSGFLMWKTDYAEYYFTEKFWPEFEKEDFVKALINYSDRKRRFGK